jgi:hypothetical protein
MFKPLTLLSNLDGYRGVINDQKLGITHDARDLLGGDVRLLVDHQGDVVGLV